MPESRRSTASLSGGPRQGGGGGAVFACILVAGMLTNDCGVTFDTAHVSLHLLLQLIMS